MEHHRGVCIIGVMVERMFPYGGGRANNWHDAQPQVHRGSQSTDCRFAFSILGGEGERTSINSGPWLSMRLLRHRVMLNVSIHDADTLRALAKVALEAADQIDAWKKKPIVEDDEDA